MSQIDLSEIADDMTGAAKNAKKMYKKAKRLSPSMKKEITVTTQYFSRKCNRHPCAKSLFKLDIDCSLLKLVLFMFVFMCACSFMCMILKKKKKKED